MKFFLSVSFLLIQIFPACLASEKPFTSDIININSAALAPLPKGDYLAVDDHSGIRWLDAHGKSLARLAVAAELLDWRDNTAVIVNGTRTAQIVVATLLLPEQQPALVTLDRHTKTIRELVRLPVPSFKIENLCLSRDRAGNLSLYLLDERGTAEHWLVLDAQGRQEPKKIRSLPIPPNSKACAVDDEKELLFIAEESVGVWSLDASAETAPGRKIVDLIKPFGKLSDAVELLAAIPGGLALYEPKSKSLLLYRKKNNGFHLEKTILVGAVDDIDNLAVGYSRQQQQLTALLFDESTQQHYRLDIAWHFEPEKAAMSFVIKSVTADAQTEAMARFGDAADDPAIWVNKRNPRKSRVIGTNKQQGLLVYDLQGKQVQHFNTGKLNNVDVRYGIPVGNKRVDIAVATNRDDNSLAIYTIDPSGKLSFSGQVKTDLDEIYGFCLYQSAEAASSKTLPKTYAIPNGKSGEFQQIELTASIDGKKKVQWHGNVVRRFYVKSQPEGCVADDKNQRLFLGEEDAALWTLGAEPDAGIIPELVLAAGDVLVADIEGLGIYQGPRHSYVVVSSQGNNSFVVMDALPPFKVRGRVRIDMDAKNGIDGVSETDGLEVSSFNLGGAFNEGLLVVQDGHKVMPEAPQNFKYIDWKKIRTALQLD
jgi:3-phytase